MKQGICVTGEADIPHVVGLVKYQSAPFAQDNLQDVLKSSVFSIGIFHRDAILVHLSFTDHFVLENVVSSTSDWVSWLENAIERKRFQCFNTLFLQSCIYKTQYEENLRKILIKSFKMIPLVEYFVFFCRNSCEVNPIFHNFFKRKSVNGLGDYSLWVCKRNVLIPLRIRDIVLEDYDDVVRLLNDEEGLLEKVYGIGYITDFTLVEGKSLFKALAIVDEKPVGLFYASSSDINLEELNINFQLEEFYGLRRPTISDEVPQDIVVLTEEASDEENKKDKKDKENNEINITHLSRLHNRQSAYLSGNTNRQIWCKIRNQHGLHRIDDPYQYVIEKEEEKTNETHDMEFFDMETTEQPNRPQKHELPLMPEFCKIQIPQYDGRSNCFQIYHVSIVKKYQSEIFYFLKSAFRKLAHLEYCILMIPFDLPNFPISQHFFQVPPRPLSCCPQTLLVFHKAGVLSNFHVRQCIKEDFPRIKYMLDSLCYKNYVLLDLRDILLSTNSNENGSTAVVATCFDTVVGIAIIKPLAKFAYISSHFNLPGPSSIDAIEQHGMLHHCVLNPSLKLMSKCFLREIMRLTGKSCLYYRIYPPNVPFGNCLWQCGCNVLDDLIPLKPLAPVIYDLEQMHGTCPSEEVRETEKNFLVYFTNKELAVLPREVNTARIVVVGASDVALSFLKTIIYDSSTLFSSLFIVSPCGLPGEYPSDVKRSKFLPNNVQFNDSTLNAMCLHSRVNVIYGKLIAIMRKIKKIKLNNGAELAYDYLILACGLQYQRYVQSQTKVSNINLQKDETNKENKDSQPTKKFTCLPMSVETSIKPAQNLFAINNTYDAAVALKWLGEKFVTTPGQIIIYGNSIEAYTCLVGILNANITGDNIILAKTTPDERYPVFKEKALEGVVTSLLEHIGVTIYSEATLDFQFIENFIYKVNISATNVKRPLDCRAVFMCNEKKIDYLMYNALFRAMLNFDGRLSVDTTFKTNDERIYAAGAFTKFRDEYFANHYNGVKFSSEELGKTLAQNLLKLLSQTEDDTGSCTKLPSFTEPIILSAELVPGYHYLLVDKPRYNYKELDVPENLRTGGKTHFKPSKIVFSNITETVLISEDERPYTYCDKDEIHSNEAHDEDIHEHSSSPEAKETNSEPQISNDKVTVDIENALEHFSLEFDEFYNVETITCFSKQEIPARNLVRLHGLHYSYFEVLFNEVKDIKPSDVIKLFQQPWCMAMYHDLFKQLRQELVEYRPSVKDEGLSNDRIYKSNECRNEKELDGFIKMKLHEFLHKHSMTLTFCTVEESGKI